MAAKKTNRSAKAATKAVRLTEAPLVGHATERAALAALRQRGFPQTSMITGPVGTGKLRLALWSAALVLCRQPTEDGPCGRCNDCTMAFALSHPDLHIYLPHTTPRSGSTDREVDDVEEQCGDLVAAMRENALYPPAEPGTSYFAADARAIRRHALTKPFQDGGRTVFIIADADRLMPADGRAEAANALLKTLEEPPAFATFILTTAAPLRMLPTVRSRVREFRLAPLANADVERVLTQARPDLALDPRLAEAVNESDGSVTQALRWLDDDWQALRERALGVFRVGLSGDLTARYDLIAAQDAKGAAGVFATMLGVVQQIAYRLAFKADQPLDRALADVVSGHEGTSATLYARVAQAAAGAQALARGNGNPQLLLHRVLRAFA